LEDRGDLAPADLLHLALALTDQILTRELDAAANDLGTWWKEADDGVASGRLAAAGLPHQTKRFSRFQAKANPVDRFHYPGALKAEVMRLQIFDV
jgi:hypothetical protein